MERGAQDRLGVGLIVGSLACAATLFGIAYARAGLRDERDPRSACRLEEPPAGYVALVVDETDVMNARQIERLERERDRILSDVGPEEMVSVYVVDERTTPVADPVLALCSPGAGRDANPLYQNPHQHEARFRRDFAARLDAVVDDLATPRTSPRSPILETVHAVASSPEFTGTPGRRRLVIVSDLLQNVPEFSQYEGDEWDAFHTSGYASRVAADLAGADVRVVYLRRAKDLAFQTAAHRAFWERYLRESGASQVEFVLQ